MVIHGKSYTNYAAGNLRPTLNSVQGPSRSASLSGSPNQHLFLTGGMGICSRECGTSIGSTLEQSDVSQCRRQADPAWHGTMRLRKFGRSAELVAGFRCRHAIPTDSKETQAERFPFRNSRTISVTNTDLSDVVSAYSGQLPEVFTDNQRGECATQCLHWGSRPESIADHVVFQMSK